MACHIQLEAVCLHLPFPAGECAKKGTMAVVPNKGDALLFWDMLPNGQQVDRRALHASCPTLKVGLQRQRHRSMRLF
jgi:hypothetical protein